MNSKRAIGSFAKLGSLLLAALLLAGLLGNVWAQVTASITGTVKDDSGAIVPGAAVTMKNLETGLARTTETDSNGSYGIPSLPIGKYELTAEKTGFKQEVRRGITLVVAQQAVVNLALELGNVEQQVTVTAEAPIVNTTLSSTSGLVGEKQVKDLPLNGRSYDQLLTLNVGTVNYTSNTSAGRGDFFSVAGRRPEETRFLMNGVDYIGTDATASESQPIGASRELLGVSAVREFNLVEHTYGAEYGKRSGGQVNIVTSSGTNQLHGEAFEYLRNSDLDARNFFDHTIGAPPFKRNQFGGALGGPLKKDKLFLFGNYEGFRQRLGISNVATLPDAQARQGFLPTGPNNSEVQVANLAPGMLPFFAYWPVPNGPELGGGLAQDFSNPLQTIREDFGLTRFDYNISAKDSFSVNYLTDDGESVLPQADRNFFSPTQQGYQLLGLQETRVFSATVLNVSTFGFSRAKTSSAILPAVPIPANLSLISGFTPGSISLGGGSSVQSGGAVTPANGQALSINARDFFTLSDDVHLIRGRHSFSAGVWVQRVWRNALGNTVNSAGTVSYSTLLAFLQNQPTQFQGFTKPTELGLRSTEAAWYVQDEIKLKPNLTLRLGLRDEMTTGWNEHTGRCSNYTYDSNGIPQTIPLIGSSCLTQNNAIALWQPRVGLAWDPTGTGTWAVRAGFGIYNDLEDNPGLVTANYPFNALLTTTAPLLSFAPVPGGTAPLPACNAQLQAANQPCSIYAPSGVEPTMHTPTVQQWSFTLEREVSKDLMLQLSYVGSQAYHLPMSLSNNVAPPQVCANPQGCPSGGVKGAVAVVPQGTTYMPPGLRPNPYLSNSFQLWWFVNHSSYNGGSISLVKRASHGLTFKANYTFSKSLDLASSISNPLGSNDPGHPAWNPYNLGLSKGVSAFSVRNQFNGNFSYELPFGHGRHWGGGASGVTDKLIGGWQWNAIFTAQSGFPFTPEAGQNISGTGFTENPDPPSRNPAFSGPVILGTVSHWFDPKAFILPIAGTFGNVARGSFIGPGLIELDTSLFKNFKLNERWSMQFRAEAFNIPNHANFSFPNQVVFSGTNVSPSAGTITNTATTSRQLQFALKLVF